MNTERLLAEAAQLATLPAPDYLTCLELLDQLETLLWADPTLPAAVQARAQTLLDQLQILATASAARLRAAIQAGAGPQTLWPLLAACAPDADEGYDAADTLINTLLEPELTAEPAPLPPELVFLQPTPARHIADLLRRAALAAADTLVDLGCGLGHVVLTTTICTPAQAVGIEVEPAYVDAAQRSASALQQRRAAFVCQDARQADFATGTLFFLYTPFTGSVLRSVLERLRAAAAQRQFRVAAYGPCGATLAAEPWLRAEQPLEPGRVALWQTIG